MTMTAQRLEEIKKIANQIYLPDFFMYSPEAVEFAEHFDITHILNEFRSLHARLLGLLNLYGVFQGTSVDSGDNKPTVKIGGRTLLNADILNEIECGIMTDGYLNYVLCSEDLIDLIAETPLQALHEEFIVSWFDLMVEADDLGLVWRSPDDQDPSELN